MDERIVYKKPNTLDFPEAAALPLVGLTVWESFYEIFRLDKNTEEQNKSKIMLINAAAGGVGSLAI